jgi:predicted nucleic acid-binding protein
LAVILDTNAVSALFVGDPALGQALAGDLRHHLPTIVIVSIATAFLARSIAST